MKLQVFDVDHIVEDNNGIMRLFCKDDDGKTVLVLDSSFEPYFYSEPREGKSEEYKKKLLSHEFREGKVKRVEEVEKEFFGDKKKLIKIITQTSKDVPRIREIIKEWPENREEYEYTIPFHQRYLIDKKIKPMNWIEVEGEETKNKEYQVDKVIIPKNIKPIDSDKSVSFKILAFDIEIAEVNNKEEIIMISFAGNKGFKKLLTTGKIQKPPKWIEILPNEKSMLERFVQIIKDQDPQFLTGYNSDLFDFMKIKERADKLRVPLILGNNGSETRLVRRGRISSTKMTGRVHIDIFSFISHIFSPSLKSEVLSLNAVAKELLGLKKKDLKWKDIEKSWKEKKGLKQLAEYCLWDSELTLKLSEQILPQVFTISELTGLIPFDASRFSYSQLDEAYLVRKAVEQNVLIPNNPKYDEIAKRRMKPVYTGGLVIEPEKGIHSDILVFDFRSLYPTIISTHNISPDTLDCEHKECAEKKVPDMDYHFCTKEKGFIPRNLEEVIKRRIEVKKKMKGLSKDSDEYKRLDNLQYTLKIIANSTYGYLGYVGAKWYCYPCASSTAAFGRFYISKSIDIIKNEGFDVIYADTDSVFFRIPDSPKSKLIKRTESFLEKINDALPGIIELEFRGLYEGGIFVAVKGEKRGAKKRYALVDKDGNLEIRGFETVRKDWCQLAKDTQYEVLRIILQEKNPDKAVKLVRDRIKTIKDGKASLDELVIYTQLTMPLSEYKSIGPHVKVAQKMKQRGRLVGEGMVMEYIISNKPGSISEKAEPIEDVKEREYDADYYINHQVLPAAMRVLQALGISEQQVISGKVQTKLEKWFTD